ncbi:MAG TPA: hypothetical protein ENF61_01455 [Firmicutes bacterium]|nr:MAG: hypothetical protein DRP67_03780 [Candidatus Omnitrophota bacterium]HDD64761.1 hypothetical protein [Bacillota bacterium]
MITEIGLIAGEILQYLDKYNETTLSNILKVIEKDRDAILMSVGWLAREGHIILRKENQDYKIILRKKE